MSSAVYSSARVLFKELTAEKIPLLHALPRVHFKMDRAPQSFERFWHALLEERAKRPQIRAPGDIALRYAPAALCSGAWLSSAARIQNSQTLSGQHALSAFHFFHGQGSVGKNRGNLYRSILGSTGTQLPGFACLADDERLRSADFVPAALSLLMGRCGPALLPEILGYHAAQCVFGVPEVLTDALPMPIFTEAENEWLLRSARDCLYALEQEGRCDWQRVYAGARISIESERNWLLSLRPEKQPSARERMEHLVKSRSPHAFGFHSHVRMDNETLDHWMQEGDASVILQRLAESKWIVPGRPEDSPLLSHSVQFGGPMFGVFSESELQTIRDWILELKAAPPQSEPVAAQAPDECTVEVFWKEAASTQQPELSVLYHQLLNAERYPESREWGRAYVQSVLGKTETRIRSGKFRKQAHASSVSALHSWVNERIREQVHGPLPVSGNLVGHAISRKDAVWALTQLAPAALVDGGWLQGIFGPGLAQSALLFEIYRDELGSGLVRQHHGNVMKRTLEAQGVILPEAHRPEFASFTGFTEAAFAMPAYWLSISENHREFFPELLGLNLAVEMAGVGQGYRAAVDALNVHGIDPYFFVLHNTIDNALSGHTALSVRAIQDWLGSLPLHENSEELAGIWKRIWCGFFSYQTASRPLLTAFARRLGFKIFCARIREIFLRITGK